MKELLLNSIVSKAREFTTFSMNTGSDFDPWQCFLTQTSFEISIAMLDLIVCQLSIELRVNLKLSHTEPWYFACTEKFSVHTEKEN